MTNSADRLGLVQERIRLACERSGRPVSEVSLVAVSKRFPASDVEPLWQAGQRDFGESRQQEGSEKVAGLPPAIHWHFIGKLQRNKVRKVLQDFSVIHSVDSLKLAAHVDRIAGELGTRPKVFLEVNQAGEGRKGGFSEEVLKQDLEKLVSLSNIELTGLMSIPPVAGSPEEARPWFARLRDLRDGLIGDDDQALPGLSMGMSHDFEVAIEEGSTMVRVGSAIFGQRPTET